MNTKINRVQRVSKYYENDCLQNFLLHFRSLLTAKRRGVHFGGGNGYWAILGCLGTSLIFPNFLRS